MTPMRVAIITSLPAFQSYYSVARCVQDQIAMLEKAGHSVTLYVKQGYNPSYGTVPCISNRVFTPGIQVKDTNAQANVFAKRFGKGELNSYDAIFTHDAVFLDSMAGYRDAIRRISPSVPGKWFHWSHSVPRDRQEDCWKGIPGHVYISLCEEHVPAICSMYGIDAQQVGVIWNPTDITDMFSGPTQQLITELELLDSDILAVLPFSTGRLKQKGVQRAVEYYAELARMGYRVKVLLCNALARGPALSVKTEWGKRFEAFASDIPMDVWWMSDIRPQWDAYTPNAVIRELQMLANVFIYPTIGEGWSLAISEAMVGGAFMVLPESRVAGMQEMQGDDVDNVFLCYWQEGNWKRKKFKPAADVAKEIAAYGPGTLSRHVQRHRRRWRLSRDRVWRDMYVPLLRKHCPGDW